MIWELVEGLTGKGREEIKHAIGVMGKRLVGSFVCRCNHIKSLHAEGEGKCGGRKALNDPAPCECKRFEAYTQG